MKGTQHMVTSIAPSLRPNRHPMEGDLDELRSQALRKVALGGIASAFALMCAALTIPSLVEPRLLLLVAVLLVSAIVAWWASRHWYWPATIFLIAGLLAATGIAEVVYALPQMLFALPLVVFVAPLLVGQWATLLVAGSASALIWKLASLASASLPDCDIVCAQLLIVGSVGLAYVAYEPMQTMLDWTLRSYLQELRKTQEARERQMDLGRLSKSLIETCERLEHANLALEHARRAAEEARRTKDSLATAISHELRTPLNLIIGFSEAIISDAADGSEEVPTRFRSDVETIHRNACHLSDLVDDVLDLGRMDADRLALQRKRSSLAAITGEAVGAVERLYAGAGLRLTVDIPSDLPTLSVDPTRIRQVLINLLTNAVRYTDEGGVRVSARREGSDVVVSVADTGVGVSSEDLPGVFESFYQVGGTNRRGGFGLGLTVSKRFVEMHGGSMWVESQIGRGSTFHFTLPAIDNVVPAAITPDWHLYQSPHLALRPEPTVLVFDRDAEAGGVVRRYLDGYRIITARTLDEAALAAKDDAVSAVILADSAVEGGGHGDRDSLAWLPRAPVLRCGLRTVGRIGGEIGAAAFLTKPVGQERLRETLRRLNLVPRNALVVDDDPQIVDLLGRMLRAVAPQCLVQLATTGELGLELARKAPPDLVLLDLLMPGIDGREFLRIWRADSSLGGAPVIVISAAVENDDRMVVGEFLEVWGPDGLGVAELMRATRGTLDGLLRQPFDSSPAPPMVPASS